MPVQTVVLLVTWMRKLKIGSRAGIRRSGWYPIRARILPHSRNGPVFGKRPHKKRVHQAEPGRDLWIQSHTARPGSYRAARRRTKTPKNLL